MLKNLSINWYAIVLLGAPETLFLSLSVEKYGDVLFFVTVIADY